MVNLSLYTTTAVIILDSDGNRIIGKYYGIKNPYPTSKEQKVFEKGLFEKTRRANGEIILYDNQVVLYRNSIDVFFYVVGSAEENELILSSILSAFYDSISSLLRHQVEKRTLVDNLDLVVLALDETIDDGIVLETDSNVIVSRVSRLRTDTTDIPITEQTFIQAYHTARERVAERLLRGV
ncbi:clathrin adaptor complex small chain-domain-containing protein [Glomus cerebriforme]|uniref:Coatomer subunit zeta n=1 Tax=Glomus cerebriforme TaxID=658196 RepID=A0A397SQ24_9GLOM|nr:clathrin adaptor complex small chain-domain-containing protein [Glomus cerebriforme]